MKSAIIVFVLVLAAAAGVFFYNKERPKSAPAPVAVDTTTPEDKPAVATPAPSPVPTTAPETTVPAPSAIPETKPAVSVITYTDSGFSPASITIQKGDTVTFKNISTLAMWPASAKHPTHTVYPTTGGCLGSTFDACKGIQPGQSWSFQFDIAGDWKYHNHLQPSHFGGVVVK